MADFASHHLFGEQALSVVPASVQMLAKRRAACFYWGCQGPDPLFYRRVLLGGPLHRLGNRMHSEKTDELFAALARGVRDLSGAAQEIAAAYFYGFLCHYALDSTIHPFVYCRQEQVRAANARLHPSAVHSQIETDIDCLMYERLCGTAATSFDPADHYALDTEEQAVISVLLHAVLRVVYDEDVPPRELRRAMEEMLGWECFFFRSNRPLFRLARCAEQAAGHGALLTGHMKTESPTWDALNLERALWRNLWEPGTVRTDTVPELFGQARILAASLAGQYAAQMKNGWLVQHHFDAPFDHGNPKRVAGQTE